MIALGRPHAGDAPDRFALPALAPFFVWRRPRLGAAYGRCLQAFWPLRDLELHFLALLK
jgi:hypothetical protein